MPKKVNKEAKKYKAKELRKLKNKCRKLWSLAVRARAFGICEECGSDKYIQAAHVEDYHVNKNLRYELKNGVALCAGHHKFMPSSFHKSLCFSFRFMAKKRRADFEYLLKVWDRPSKEETKEFLEEKIKYLTTAIADARGG